MYASDTRSDTPFRNVRNYVLITLFVAVFGAVYEHFSFGVYSYFMLYAWMVPFVMGVLPSVFLACSKKHVAIRDAGRRLWHDAVAVLTLGSLFTGVVQIYGTQSAWSYVYALIGIVFAVLAFIYRK